MGVKEKFKAMYSRTQSAPKRSLKEGPKLTLPFSGESPEDVSAAYKYITSSGMPMEILDYILGNYVQGETPLMGVVWDALYEWDCI